MSGHTFSNWRVAVQTPSRVDTPDGSISVSWSSNSDGGERDRKAEYAARLIASAPEMLETLEAIRNAEWRDWEELASPEEFVRWAKSRANHAIAKATGGAE